VAAAVGGLAAVDARVLDDGVVDDEPGARRLRVQRHPLGGQDALALRVVPLQPHRLADSCKVKRREDKGRGYDDCEDALCSRSGAAGDVQKETSQRLLPLTPPLAPS